MNKPIAVLGVKRELIHEWIMKHFYVIRYNKQNLTYYDNRGQEFRIILNIDQARGMEFSGCLLTTSTNISFELIDFVQGRIR